MTQKVKEKSPAPVKPKKDFDAVRMMREIRNKIDKDIEGMTFEEQKAYIAKRLAKAKKK